MRKKNHGFTLIELVAVIVLMGIISVIVGSVLLNSYQSFLTSKNISEIQWKGLISLERIVDDMRTIRSSSDISTIQSNQFAFNDVNGNSVQYSLSGQFIMRNSQILSNGVQSLSFSYLDKNGSITSSASAVRYIIIGMTIAEGNLLLPFTTMAAMRGMP